MVENKILNAKLIIKHKSSEGWKQLEETILLEGEIAFETDTHKFKLGDGVTKWKDLDYGIVAKEAMHNYKPFVILKEDWKEEYSEDLRTTYIAIIPDDTVTEKDSSFVCFDKSLIRSAFSFGVSQICETVQGGVKVFSKYVPDKDLLGFYEINISSKK